MPRGKKKATVAEAPPSTPPNAKKRKMSATSAKGEEATASREVGNARKTKSTKAVTYEPGGR